MILPCPLSDSQPSTDIITHRHFNFMRKKKKKDKPQKN